MEPLMETEAFLKQFPEGLMEPLSRILDPAGAGEDSRLRDNSNVTTKPHEKGTRPRPGIRNEPTLISEDLTAPALERVLQANGEKTLIASAEAGTMLTEAGRNQSKFGALLLKGFSGDPITSHRTNRPAIHLEEPCITVLWLCQPRWLDQFLMRANALDDGLIPRFLVAHSRAVMAPMGKGDSHELSVGFKDAYGAVIGALFDTYFQEVN